MPIRYQIDPQHRLVVAWAEGVFREEDIYAYQNAVWSRPEVSGFNSEPGTSAVSESRTRPRRKSLASKLVE